jgi:predicted nucleotide-binding protein
VNLVAAPGRPSRPRAARTAPKPAVPLAATGYTTGVSQPPGTAELPTAFFSYARADAPIVRTFAQHLRAAGINVFLDTEFLKPGERFEKVILEKVRSADALVFFVSPSSLQSKWVETELLAFSDSSNKLIIPVLINGARYADLPLRLARYQGVVVGDDAAVPVVASRLADTLHDQVGSAAPPRLAEHTPEAGRRGADLAASIAADIRAPAVDPQSVGSSVFLVHGHDVKFRDEVAGYLRDLKIEPVILSQVRGGARSLLDKFEALATQAIFAVVLMSPDDVGASLRQYGHKRGRKKALKYRARENVILELGFFYGRLGWDHVFIVRKPAQDPVPDFELPSDLAGALIVETAAEVDWHEELAERLREAKLIGAD